MPPPLGREGTPLTPKPSSRARIRTPRARRAFVTVSTRSVSLTRSSRAPRTSLMPRAHAAASAKSGSSSRSRGTSSGSTAVATSGADCTSRSATGSPPSRRRLKTVTRAPIRPRTSSSRERRADPSERLRDTIDRRAAQRLVAGQLVSPFLRGDDPGQEPEQRPCVAAVDRDPGRAQAMHSPAGDPHDIHVLLGYAHAERAYRLDRRLRVGRPAEAANERLALAERTDEHGPVRDGLVPRDGDVPDERTCRRHLRHSGSSGETSTA